MDRSTIFSLLVEGGNLTSFLNKNGGLWTFVSLPLVAIATAAAVIQLVPWLKTAVRDDARNMAILRKQVKRLRIELDLNPRLVLGTLLSANLRSRNPGGPSTPAELYESLRDGTQAFVVGSAGAGKSILALTLVDESLRRSEADPDQPLMEVLPLRKWRKSIFRPAGTNSLLSWMAESLRDEYPMFNKRFFVELLRSHRLIPCLDGLDEVEEDRRPQLLGSLRSYMAAGMPMVVLSRESDVPSLRPGGTDEPIRRFDVHELLPLTPAAMAQVAEAQLEDLPRRSLQPHRVSRLLGNPLILSIVARTRRAGALESLSGNDDPEDKLWEAFFDSGLGKGTRQDKGSLRARAGIVALLVHQSKQDVFRIGDLYVAHPAIGWTLAVLAVPAFALGWAERASGVAVLLLFNASLTLVPWSDLWFARASRRVFYRRRGLRNALTLLLLLCAGIALAVLGGLAESFFRHILLEGEPVAHWWRNYGRGHLDLNWTVYSPFLLLWGFAGASYLDLTSRQTVEVFLPRRIAPLGIPLAGLALAAFAFSGQRFSFLYLGLFILIPWIFMCTSRLVLTVTGYIPASGLRSTCEAMARAGILHAHESRFRFRHGELSIRLAQEAVCRLAEISELALMLDRKRPYLLIDGRIGQATVDSWAPVIAELSELNSRDEEILSIATLYWYYGKLEPTVVVPLVRKHVKRYPHSPMAVPVAEVLDAEGRRDEAEAFWSQGLASSPWLLHRWIRRQVVQGHVRVAVEELEQRVQKQAADLVSLERLLLAELHCRFGSGPVRAAGLEQLRRICKVDEPYLSRRALLEFARVRAEDLGSIEKAEEMLSSTLDEGVLDALKYARSAQLCLLTDRHEEAGQYGREAYALVQWVDNPVHQLEVIVTAAYAVPELQEDLLSRLRALTGFGWCLRGRSTAWIDPHSARGSELLDLAFR